MLDKTAEPSGPFRCIGSKDYSLAQPGGSRAAAQRRHCSAPERRRNGGAGSVPTTQLRPAGHPAKETPPVASGSGPASAHPVPATVELCALARRRLHCVRSHAALATVQSRADETARRTRIMDKFPKALLQLLGSVHSRPRRFASRPPSAAPPSSNGRPAARKGPCWQSGSGRAPLGVRRARTAR